ncbi:MAG: PDZ domain-containing protein [Planctomycetota bacterium]|nr:PDZ domain-containing protein [Planctomycetota bacterium]MDG1986017.1 PDZ domain-containing protein [Planctomycetota bacterium]
MALSLTASLRPLLTLGLLGAAASCQYAPERTIPDPLPETLEWALPDSGTSGFLGVEVRENDSGSLESLSFDPGVRVHTVTERSPAAEAGIQTDDVLLEFNGQELAVPEDLQALLDGFEGEAPVTAKVQRGDTAFEVKVTVEPGAGPAMLPDELFVLDTARTLGAWGTADGAVLVARNSKGPVRDLPVGTRVVALNDEPIVSGRGLVRRLVAMEPGAKVSLTLEGDDGEPRVRTIGLLGEGRRVTRASVPILTTYTATADRSRTSFVLLDLYVISLLRYSREGGEKRFSVLRFFQWNTGVGELDE